MQKSVQLGDDDADIDVWIEQQRIERRERAEERSFRTTEGHTEECVYRNRDAQKSAALGRRARIRARIYSRTTGARRRARL